MSNRHDHRGRAETLVVIEALAARPPVDRVLGGV